MRLVAAVDLVGVAAPGSSIEITPELMEGRGVEPANDDQPDGRGRNMSRALLANLLLLAVIAALALALLVIAVSRS